MEKGEFYVFKIKGWKYSFVNGVIEAIGSEWILIKLITGDYFFDGYCLIQRKYIKCSIRDSRTMFKEAVLLAKGVMNISGCYDIPLDTQIAPFVWLNRQNLAVQFNPKDDSICYVGKVGKITKKNFELISMDTRGKWDTDFYKYTFASMRTIYIHSDYVNSLLIYNEQF